MGNCELFDKTVFVVGGAFDEQSFNILSFDTQSCIKILFTMLAHSVCTQFSTLSFWHKVLSYYLMKYQAAGGATNPVPKIV